MWYCFNLVTGWWLKDAEWDLVHSPIGAACYLVEEEVRWSPFEIGLAVLVLAGIAGATYWYVKSSLRMCRMLNDMEDR